MTILLIFYFLFFLLLSIKNLKWAIYLLIFALPSYLIRFEIAGLPMTVLELMILVLFGVWLIKRVVNENLRQDLRFKIYDLRSLFLFIATLLIAASISVFVGPELRAAAGIWKAYFIEPLLFFIVFITTLKKEDLKGVFVCLGLSIFVLSLVAIYQKITGNLISNPFWAAEATRRVSSVFEYPNALALFLAPVLIMLLGGIGALRNLKNKKLLVTGYWLLVTGAALAATYFTKAKGALLGILAGLIFYALFYKNYRKYFVGILGVITIFIFLYFYIFNIPLSLQGQATVEGGDSITTRIEMWQETWQMLKERPILGAGLAGYQSALEPYHQKEYIEIYLYPHNFILTFWSELGILGLLGLLGILGWFYYVGFRILKQANKLTRYENNDKLLACYLVTSLAAMTTLLVHGLVDVPYFKNDLSVLFWIVVGNMIILYQDKIREIKGNKV